MGLNTTYNKWWKNEENDQNLSDKYQEKFGDKRPGYNKEEERKKNEANLMKFINEIRSLGSTSFISLLR